MDGIDKKQVPRTSAVAKTFGPKMRGEQSSIERLYKPESLRNSWKNAVYSNAVADAEVSHSAFELKSTTHGLDSDRLRDLFFRHFPPAFPPPLW